MVVHLPIPVGVLHFGKETDNKSFSALNKMIKKGILQLILTNKSMQSDILTTIKTHLHRVPERTQKTRAILNNILAQMSPSMTILQMQLYSCFDTAS